MTALVMPGVVPAKAGPIVPDIMAHDIMASGIWMPAYAGMAARESE
jgi:hypothetical protein